MKIAIKWDGYAPKELQEAYSSKYDGTFALETSQKSMRNGEEVLQFVTDHYAEILVLLSGTLVVWNKIMELRKFNLEKCKLLLEKRKFDLDTEKHKLDVKEYELKVLAFQAKKEPQIATLQLKNKKDLIVPLNLDELQMSEYFAKEAVDLTMDDIKSIYIK